MLKLFILFLVINNIWVDTVLAQSKTPLTIVTEDLYPFNYMDNDEVKGSVAEKIKKSLQQLGLADSKITVLPWARAYLKAQNEENVLIFSMLKTKDREDMFKWVAKVGEMQVGVMKLKSRTDIQINTMKDLSAYKLAVFVDSPMVGYLGDNGIVISDVVGKYDSVIHLLRSGRVDLVPSSVVGFLSTARKLGFADEFDVVFYFDELGKDLYAAFSKQTSDELVNKFKEALQKIEEQQ